MHTHRSYILGAAPRFERRFYDQDTLVLVDPTIVAALVIDPTGIERQYVYAVDPELVQVGTGIYQIQIELTLAGEWTLRFRSEGSHISAREIPISVRPSAFTTTNAQATPSANLVFAGGSQVFVGTEIVEV